MNELYTTLSLGLMLAWLVVISLKVFLPVRWAVGVGILVGLLAALLARQTLPVQVLASLFEPVALGLSFLIARSLAKPFQKVQPVPVWEQCGVLVLLLGYLLASAGVTMFDPYRFGFDPVWAGLLAAACCIYGGLRGYVGFALLPVVAQIVWLSGLGSSNYFDHLFSALMVPVVLTSILFTLSGFRGKEVAEPN